MNVSSNTDWDESACNVSARCVTSVGRFDAARACTVTIPFVKDDSKREA